MLNSNKRSLVKQIYENLTGERQEKVFCEEFYWKKICEFFALTEVYNSKISYVNALLRANNLDEASSYEGALSVLLDKVYGDHGKYTSVEALLRRLAFKTSFKVNSANGNVIVLNTPYSEKLQSLKVFGRSTQDDTPSPENPVPINTAGSNGQIGVSVGGGNMLDASKLTPSGSSIRVEDNGKKISITGKSSYCGARITSEYISMFDNLKGENVFINTKFTGNILGAKVMVAFSYKITGDERVYYINYSSQETEGNIFGSAKVPKNAVLQVLQININHSATELSEDMTVIFEDLIIGIGTSLPWEPYVTPQTLILSTPNGLPGVPVDASATEYTYQDASGQKWIADSVEMFADGTGQLVQRTILYNANDLEWRKDFTSTLYRYSSFNHMELIDRVSALSNRFVWKYSQFTSGDFSTEENKIRVNFEQPFESVDALMQWFSENDTVFLLQLATPITTPLSAEEVTAFKTLTTYEPTTVIQNDAGCWMEVGYKSLITKNIEKIPRALSAPFVFEDKEVI